jgi:aryl-alcohol dehydrogenase-like predicted oxidoreductase
VKQGKVCYIGASNYAAYRLTESVMLSKMLGLSRFVGLQAHYSLISREIEREHAPACLRFGVGLLPWSPLDGGFLSGKYRRGAGQPSGARLTVKEDRFKKLDTERNWKIVDELVAVANEIGQSPATLALAWLLAKPSVSSVIIGARSLEQLETNNEAAGLKIPKEAFDRLEAVSALKLDHPYDFLRKVQGGW